MNNQIILELQDFLKYLKEVDLPSQESYLQSELENARRKGVSPSNHNPIQWANAGIKSVQDAIEEIEKIIKEMEETTISPDFAIMEVEEQAKTDGGFKRTIQSYTDYVVRTEMKKDKINTNSVSSIDMHVDDYLEKVENNDLHRITLNSIIERDEIKTTEVKKDDILLDVLAKHVIEKKPEILETPERVIEEEIKEEPIIEPEKNELEELQNFLKYLSEVRLPSQESYLQSELENARRKGVSPSNHNPIQWANAGINMAKQSILLVSDYIAKIEQNPSQKAAIFQNFKVSVVQNSSLSSCLTGYTDYSVRNKMKNNGVNVDNNYSVSSAMEEYVGELENSELHKMSLSMIAERDEIKTTEVKKDDILLDICVRYVIKDNEEILKNVLPTKDEMLATQIVEAMAQGVDVLGENTNEIQESNTRTMGFAKVWVLGIITAIISIGIIILGIVLIK